MRYCSSFHPALQLETLCFVCLFKRRIIKRRVRGTKLRTVQKLHRRTVFASIRIRWHQISCGFLTFAGPNTTRTDVDPFVWHHLTTPLSRTTPPSTKRLRAWTRTRGHLSKSSNAHLAVLACLTDSWFLSSLHELNPSVAGSQAEKVGFMATLNHTIWFHDPT